MNHLKNAAHQMSLQETLLEIIMCLNEGCKGVGFVSPTHFVPQVKIIINSLRTLNIKPTFVYNSNGYDKVETLRTLEPYIDVYLPDFKYSDPELSKKIFGCRRLYKCRSGRVERDVPSKGSTLLLDEDGVALHGILIRHLVLPGHLQNSIDSLRHIADNLSTSMHLSLMSQYHPTRFVNSKLPISRTLNNNEYRQVIEEFYNLGFTKGWLQDLESYNNYLPDFDKNHPFES